jgi:hypothetical protein
MIGQILRTRRYLSRTGLCAVVVSLMTAVVAAKAQAANISVERNVDDQVAIVTVDGKLFPDDDDQFRKQTIALSKAMVVLRSEGGDVVAGVQIGETIRRKGFSSLVVGKSCASACAVAWLGGAPRLMAPAAQVGFHAAYDTKTGQETGVGNALIGAYLNKIELSYEAVSYVTRAAPDSMRWLTISEAKRLGIDATLFNGVVPEAPFIEAIPAPQPDKRPPPNSPPNNVAYTTSGVWLCDPQNGKWRRAPVIRRSDDVIVATRRYLVGGRTYTEVFRRPRTPEEEFDYGPYQRGYLQWLKGPKERGQQIDPSGPCKAPPPVGSSL